MLQNDMTDRVSRLQCFWFWLIFSAPPFAVHFNTSLQHVVFNAVKPLYDSDSDHFEVPERPQSTYHNIPAQSILRIEICIFLCLAGNGSCLLKSCKGTRDSKGQNDKKSRRGALRSHLFQTTKLRIIRSITEISNFLMHHLFLCKKVGGLFTLKTAAFKL